MKQVVENKLRPLLSASEGVRVKDVFAEKMQTPRAFFLSCANTSGQECLPVPSVIAIKYRLSLHSNPRVRRTLAFSTSAKCDDFQCE